MATTRQGLVSHIREISILLGGYFTYMFVRKVIVPGADAIGLENARELISFEKVVGVFWEPTLQDWGAKAGRRVLVFFNYLYIVTFVPVVLTTAVVLYIKNRERYLYYRGIVLLSFAAALLVFAIFPLAPPRFVSLSGLADTIAVHGPLWYAGRELAVYYNAFAAMPSLHFSWALLIGFMFWRSGPWLLKPAAVIYPAATLLAIIITGNHYVMDAVVGALMMLIIYELYEHMLGRGVTLRFWRNPPKKSEP
ncbi:MAG: phosphatase PAP2 family protein [Dehalococcoidia bacterium]